MIEKQRKALKKLNEALKEVKWARIGAESLRDRGITTRMSVDIDIAVDAAYAKIAKELRKSDIKAPLHTEKGTRITLRRGVLMTDVEGVEVDIHFGNDSKKKTD